MRTVHFTTNPIVNQQRAMVNGIERTLQGPYHKMETDIKLLQDAVVANIIFSKRILKQIANTYPKDKEISKELRDDLNIAVMKNKTNVIMMKNIKSEIFEMKFNLFQLKQHTIQLFREVFPMREPPITDMYSQTEIDNLVNILANQQRAIAEPLKEIRKEASRLLYIASLDNDNTSQNILIEILKLSQNIYNFYVKTYIGF